MRHPNLLPLPARNRQRLRVVFGGTGCLGVGVGRGMSRWRERCAPKASVFGREFGPDRRNRSRASSGGAEQRSRAREREKVVGLSTCLGVGEWQCRLRARSSARHDMSVSLRAITHTLECRCFSALNILFPRPTYSSGVAHHITLSPSHSISKHTHALSSLTEPPPPATLTSHTSHGLTDISASLAHASHVHTRSSLPRPAHRSTTSSQ
jgi:hypothetical protein